MIKKICIKNFALIREAEINFAGNLCVITGETGAGKSSVAQAFEFILGGKAKAELISDGETFCQVYAEFENCQQDKVKKDPSICSLRRVMDKDLKNKFFINSRQVSMRDFRQACYQIADFYGQQESAFICCADTQLDIIDTFGKIEKEKEEYLRVYNEKKNIISKIEAISLSAGEKERLIDMYSFELGEIEKLNINPQKDSCLEETILKIKEKDRISRYAGRAFELLNNSDASAHSCISQALSCLSNLEGKIPQVDKICLRLRNMIEEVNYCVESLSSILSGNEMTEADVDRIIERDEKIKRLKKKYQCELEGLLEKAQDLREKLQNLSENDFNLSELEKKLTEAEKKLEKKASALSLKRKKSAETLTKLVSSQLKDLGLDKASFFAEIDYNAQYECAKGFDRVEFLFSANAGSPAKPLRFCASLGEISRLSLALKASFSSKNSFLFSVFDEIDTGVGGNTAFLIGEKLKKISCDNKVIFITHSPQAAAFADCHIKAEKKTVAGKTRISFHVLSLQQRKAELARMLGSRFSPETALNHADNLLKTASISHFDSNIKND